MSAVTIFKIATYIEKNSRVLVCIINPDSATMNADVKSDAEVLRHEGSKTVAFEYHLSL